MKLIKTLVPLVLVCCILLCGCDVFDFFNKSSGTDDKNNDEIVLNDNGKDYYTELECRVPEAYSEQSFSYAEKRLALSIPHPSDWTFEENQYGGFNVIRDGNKIGTVSREGDGDEDWTSVKRNTVANDVYSVKCVIQKSLVIPDTFRYSIQYSYTEDLVEMSMTLQIKYEEICADYLEMLRYDTGIISLATDPNMGVLSDIQKNKPVVFVGNSFIGSSQVAEIFKEMLREEGKSLTVMTRAYGGAQLEDFANNTSLINEIKRGTFGTVFLCGFYGYSQVDMDVIVNACKQGNATLAVFPAHNENSTSIRIVKMQYPELAHINWKAEIDALIANGVDPLDMYVEDAHHHSTTLAGYVGAQMAYRAIFGEIPTKQLSDTISTSYVKSKLGDYVERGFVYTESFDGILFID